MGLPSHLRAVHEVPGPDSEELLSFEAGHDNLACWTLGYRTIVHVENELELEPRTNPSAILELKIRVGLKLGAYIVLPWSSREDRSHSDQTGPDHPVCHTPGSTPSPASPSPRR